MTALIKILMIILMNSFIYLSSPFMKIIILTFNIITLMFIFNFINKTSWLMMMFIILMLGGLMILFIYFTSLFKEKKMINLKMAQFFSLVFILNLTFKNINLKMTQNLESYFLNYFINLNTSMIMVMLIIYMLLLLIINLEMISNMKTCFRMAY